MDTKLGRQWASTCLYELIAIYVLKTLAPASLVRKGIDEDNGDADKESKAIETEETSGTKRWRTKRLEAIGRDYRYTDARKYDQDQKQTVDERDYEAPASIQRIESKLLTFE